MKNEERNDAKLNQNYLKIKTDISIQKSGQNLESINLQGISKDSFDYIGHINRASLGATHIKRATMKHLIILFSLLISSISFMVGVTWSVFSAQSISSGSITF